MNIIETLAATRPGFLTFKEYTNNFGEVSNFSINFKASYGNALKASLGKLADLDLRGFVNEPEGVTLELLVQARREIAQSLQTSLDSAPEPNPAYTCAGAYRELGPGMKLHLATGALHLWGLVNHKVVLQKGTYPARNKRALTKAKDALRRTLPVGKFRQFKIEPEKFGAIRTDGIEI